MDLILRVKGKVCHLYETCFFVSPKDLGANVQT
jgi:hypothetical protein